MNNAPYMRMRCRFCVQCTNGTLSWPDRLQGTPTRELAALAGTQLLEKVLQTASEDPAVQEAYLHVQVSDPSLNPCPHPDSNRRGNRQHWQALEPCR